MSKEDMRHDISVDEYLASLDAELQTNARTICTVMQRITSEEPILYGYGTIGFGIYKYHYESGRKGEAHTLAFYPRKGKITIYLMDGTARYADMLTRLGKHSITGYCIYIKKLSDIDMDVLTEILEGSFTNITTLYKSGPIDHILWQDT